MALNFSTTEKDYTSSIREWKGLDYDTFEDNTSNMFSKNAKNMLVNANGFVEKRTGFKRVYEGTNENINGIFTFNATISGVKTQYHILHKNTSLYLFTIDTNGNITLGDMLFTGLNNTKTRAFEFFDALYIVGGGKYIKICIDKLTNTIVCGDVAETLGNPSTAVQTDTIITNRYANELNGTFMHPDTTKMYRSIKYTRKIVNGDPVDFGIGDKFLIGSQKNTGTLNVVNVYGIDANGSEYKLYRTDGNNDICCYSVVSDETNGVYVKLGNSFYTCVNTSATNASCVHGIRVVFAINDFVYTPLIVNNREPIFVSGNTDTSNELIRYTGQAVEGINLVSRAKSIQFYFDDSKGSDGKDGIRLYLMQNAVARVYQIKINDYILHYSEYNQDPDSSAKWINADNSKYVWIKRSYITQTLGLTECTITVSFISNNISENEIKDCRIYGVFGGNNDTRVFLSGNKNFPNRDYQSGLADGTYFSDNGYTNVGGDNSAIIGYQKMYSTQIILKDGAGDSSTQYLRSAEPTADGTKVNYTLTQGNNSYPASAISSCKNIGGYPFYIGKDGFMMMYGTNVKMETNTGCKSTIINSRFTKEKTSEFICIAHKNVFYAYIDNHMYLCDVKHDYNWYYYDNLPNITCLWIYNDMIYFGDNSGKIYRFMQCNEKNAYCDDVDINGNQNTYTKAIHALWEIPQSTFGSISNYKTIRNVHLSCMPYSRSHITVYYNSNEELLDNVLDENIDMFSFLRLDFNRFSFVTIKAPKEFATRVKNKNVFTFGLTLENKNINEPFGFSDVTITYRGGKVVK